MRTGLATSSEWHWNGLGWLVRTFYRGHSLYNPRALTAASIIRYQYQCWINYW